MSAPACPKLPFVAFLIPTRERFASLWTCVESILSHPDASAFSIHIRADTDDLDTMQLLPQLPPAVTIHTGPRLHGYHSLGYFYTLMAAATTAPWIWIFDDDARLEGPSFLSQLLNIPITNHYCGPEIYALNNSHYTDSYQFPLVPNNSWTSIAPAIGNPPDTWFTYDVAKPLKWQHHYLHGVTVHHTWGKRPPSHIHRPINPL